MKITNAHLKKRFPPHQPRRGHPRQYAEIREQALQLAHTLRCEVPTSRECVIALNKLEEAIIWAETGLARHGAVPNSKTWRDKSKDDDEDPGNIGSPPDVDNPPTSSKDKINKNKDGTNLSHPDRTDTSHQDRTPESDSPVT